MSTRRNPRAAIALGEAQLSDFLSEYDFVATMEGMRWRIIRVFNNAQPSAKSRTVRDRTTRGYIASVDNRLGSLANYLMTQMGPDVMQKVYSVDDLPRRYHRDTQRDREHIVQFVWYELIMRQLTLLRDAHTLYYQEGWCVPQSVMDEYTLRFGRARDNYRNEGSWHGRPNRDRTNGTIPGTSVGVQR